VSLPALEREPVDTETYQRAIERFREARIILPTFAQLADPSLVPKRVATAVAAVDPDAAHPLNLFRVHWHNDDARTGMAAVPRFVVLPTSLTGVEAKIVVALGDRFPMIRAHKVLAAYGCLAPRVVTGQFDPTAHRAVWPSTGNYCRGGVAISRIMQCHGVAVLPAGMSQERFDWLERWVLDPADIIRTPGTESNVKEIYDKCAELRADGANVILNQFSEFANHLVHYQVTGQALDRIYASLRDAEPELRLRAFTCASGSAGTLGAGDYLKERHAASIVAVEALECPTLLYNGFGEHNIQGIGDKHIPLIHNVMNTDVVTAVSDVATDQLLILFNTEVGRSFLRDRRGVPAPVLDALASLGISSICNVLAAIKMAKRYGYGANDVVLTVATDGAAMYRSEVDRLSPKHFPSGFDGSGAARAFGEHVLGQSADHLLELSHRDRERIFNLGYFTWVEQQGVELDDFVARKDQAFWRGLRSLLPEWDRLIGEFNDRTGAIRAL